MYIFKCMFQMCLVFVEVVVFDFFLLQFISAVNKTDFRNSLHIFIWFFSNNNSNSITTIHSHPKILGFVFCVWFLYPHPKFIPKAKKFWTWNLNPPKCNFFNFVIIFFSFKIFYIFIIFCIHKGKLQGHYRFKQSHVTFLIQKNN